MEPWNDANFETFERNVINWGIEHKLVDPPNLKSQFVKLIEEVGELAEAILQKDDAKFIDAIGDCVVVLTILSAQNKFLLSDCYKAAYNEIKNRRGETKDGVFTKEVEREDENNRTTV